MDGLPKPLTEDSTMKTKKQKPIVVWDTIDAEAERVFGRTKLNLDPYTLGRRNDRDPNIRRVQRI
jgi:hypothetical protein